MKIINSLRNTVNKFTPNLPKIPHSPKRQWEIGIKSNETRSVADTLVPNIRKNVVKVLEPTQHNLQNILEKDIFFGLINSVAHWSIKFDEIVNWHKLHIHIRSQKNTISCAISKLWNDDSVWWVNDQSFVIVQDWSVNIPSQTDTNFWCVRSVLQEQYFSTPLALPWLQNSLTAYNDWKSLEEKNHRLKDKIIDCANTLELQTQKRFDELINNEMMEFIARTIGEILDTKYKIASWSIKDPWHMMRTKIFAAEEQYGYLRDHIQKESLKHANATKTPEDNSFALIATPLLNHINTILIKNNIPHELHDHSLWKSKNSYLWQYVNAKKFVQNLIDAWVVAW